MKKFLKYILVTVIMLFVFVFAMYITGKIPKAAIENNVKKSVNYVVDYPFWREAFTDAIMMDMVYRHDSNNSLESSLKNITISNYPDGLDPYYNYDGQEAYKSDFYDVLNEDGTQKYIYEYEYGRYWHGYMIFLRPLLVIFDYNELCIFLMIISLALGVELLAVVNSKLGKKWMLFTVFLLFSIDYFTIISSISLTPTLMIMMISSIIILVAKNKIKDISMFFFIVGALVSYFCWMNFTIMTLTLPLLFYYLQEKDEENISLKEFFKIVIIYFLGRGIFLVLKWVTADLLCGTSIIKDAVLQVIYRLSSTTYSHTKTNFIIAIARNFSYYIYPIAIVYLYLFFRSINCKFHKEKTGNKIGKKQRLIYIFIALIPVAFYIVAVNYAYVHAITYTHRLLAVTLFAIVAWFEQNYEVSYTDLKKDTDVDERKD